MVFEVDFGFNFREFEYLEIISKGGGYKGDWGGKFREYGFMEKSVLRKWELVLSVVEKLSKMRIEN